MKKILWLEDEIISIENDYKRLQQNNNFDVKLFSSINKINSYFASDKENIIFDLLIVDLSMTPEFGKGNILNFETLPGCTWLKYTILNGAYKNAEFVGKYPDSLEFVKNKELSLLNNKIIIYSGFIHKLSEEYSQYPINIKTISKSDVNIDIVKEVEKLLPKRKS